MATSDDPAAASRRAVLDWAMKGGLAACAAGMAAPAILYLYPAGHRGPGESTASGGPASAFAPGTARMIQGDGKPVLLLSLGENRFKAFSAICTHLGCIVRWDPASRTILCPCHAGVFAPDGTVKSGPPPRPLPEYEVFVSGDEIRVKL